MLTALPTRFPGDKAIREHTGKRNTVTKEMTLMFADKACLVAAGDRGGKEWRQPPPLQKPHHKRHWRSHLKIPPPLARSQQELEADTSYFGNEVRVGSAPLPVRRPLLGKGRRTLNRIFAAENYIHLLLLIGEHFIQ